MQNFKRLSIDSIAERLVPLYADKSSAEAQIIADLILSATGHDYIQHQALENFLNRLSRVEKAPSEAVQIRACSIEKNLRSIPDWDCFARADAQEKFPGIEYDYTDLYICESALKHLINEHVGIDRAHEGFKAKLEKTFRLTSSFIMNEELGKGWRQKWPQAVPALETAVETLLKVNFPTLDKQASWHTRNRLVQLLDTSIKPHELAGAGALTLDA